MKASHIRNLIRKGEGTKLEWKDSSILSNPFKLARSIAAMANNEGGLVLIGVKDDGTFEGMASKKEHEEHIMNIAAENCDPPIRLTFQKVKISRSADIYVLNVPKRKQTAFHGVKTKDGLVYFIRTGSTVRQMRPHELIELVESGVETEPYTSSEKGMLWLSRKLVGKVSAGLHLSPSGAMLALVSVGILSIIGSLLLLFRIESSGLVSLVIQYPWWLSTLLVIWLILGALLSISIPTIAIETRCPTCKSFFSFRKTRTVILEKRTVDENLEEWRVRNHYQCGNCGYEEEKLEFEKHRTE